jgi:two-component system sensor histidine kinase KdpD
MKGRQELSSWPLVRQRTRGGLQSLLRAVPSSIVIAFATFACFAFHVNFAVVSFIFLIIVVLQSLTGDLVSAVIVSFIAFLCLNYFFVPPIFSLAVSDPSDTLALISFLITGLVITRLIARTREAADVAAGQRAQTTQLYELAQQLLASDPNASPEEGLLRRFRLRFNLAAVCLFDAATARLYIDGDSPHDLADQTRTAFVSRCNSQDLHAGVAVRLLHGEHGIIGAIGFDGLQSVELTAEPLTALAGLMIVRRLAFQRASRAAAETEAEIFRGAVLDALAHEFKTPLATISTAAGGLRAAGPLQPEQKELAEVVESEAARLGQLTSRLLRLARLDREEVKTQRELIDLAELVKSAVDQYRLRWPDRHIALEAKRRVRVLGDHELLWLGTAQLLDNACKYSGAAAQITVCVEAGDDSVVVRVRNGGAPIPANERIRIFDRFYRGVDARTQATGSGLGLYVARKIALAHGGALDLEGSVEGAGGAAFLFTIPAAKEEMAHDTEIQCISGR